MNVMKPLHLDQHGQLCILSVDDDSVNLMVMEQLLASFGWKIISALDGEEAMGVLDADAWPDLVFLDFHMETGDSGDEICKKMRAIFGSTPVPIIMCTALSAGSDAIEVCLKAGASDYLLKPYERAKVLSKIDKHLGHKLRASQRKLAPQAAAPVVPMAMSMSSPVPRPLPSPPPAPMGVLPGPPEEPSVQHFCTQLDLEYCGKKLVDAGVSFSDLKGMDDGALRKAGIVVKAQRDKLIESIRRLP